MWTPSARIKHPLPETHWPTIEEAESSLLFTPLRYRALEVNTRTWVPAMVPWRATAEGEVSDDVLRWYERFAQGRPGTIVVEATFVTVLIVLNEINCCSCCRFSFMYTFRCKFQN